MKQIKQILKIGACAMFFGASIIINSADVSAGALSERCIANSGGRGGISSVQWACNTYESTNAMQNCCSLWIGDAWSSVVPIIYVRSLTEVHTVYYYGMCTGRPNTTARVWVDDDNDAIDDSDQGITRGTWANPQGQATFLHVDRFVQNISSKEVYVDNQPTDFPVGKYDEYQRQVTIGRCHGGNASSCSKMAETVTVRIPKGTNKLTVNHVARDCYGNSTTVRSETIDFNKDGFATAQPMNSVGYQFNGWEPANVVGTNDKVDLSQGSVTVTANYTNNNVICTSGDECDAWAPASYLNSNANHGMTSVIIGVKTILWETKTTTGAI